jgi:hypothetical protein
MIEEPPVEVKRALVQQQFDLWVRTHYDASVRFRVFKAIEDTEQQAAAIKDMARCTKALDHLREELAALPGETTVASVRDEG